MNATALRGRNLEMVFYYYNILRYITLKKAFNWLKLWASFHLSRLRGSSVQWGLPVSASIEPTTSCNLRCPQCPSGLREFTRPTGMLQKPLFEKLSDELSSHLHSLTFYFQGEPYLNSDFLSLVQMAHRKGIYTITSTNAHYLTEENARKTITSGLDLLTISVDGVTQDVYEKYRAGGQLQKVMAGTREILRQKKLMNSKTPHVVWQFVVFSNNEHQIETVKLLGKEVGVDEVRIKTAQIYDFENGDQLMPVNQKYSRYRKNNAGKYEIKNQLLNKCWRMWQGTVITWDGSVVPCCFDKDADHKIGNVANSSFKKVWYSEPYRNFRNAVLSDRSQIDICKNCTEGTRVWA